MMTTEIANCIIALVCSSASQLFMKGAAITSQRKQWILRIVIAIFLQIISVLLVLFALQVMTLSQVVPFAAGAYLLVPLGSRHFFRERLTSTFWNGSLFIIIGIVLTQMRPA
jgi:drug/metabolite transporter (DMT)-like permease